MRYLRYLRRDVLVTAELLDKLLEEYERHPIDLDPAHVYSAASIAKAYLKAFGFTPPRERSSVSDTELGHAMAGFFGGRAEIHIRRELVPVTYVDLESTYPTLFTLQRLTRFLRAREIRTEDATEEVRAFVRDAEPEDFLKPGIWPGLTVMVELEADEDILPVRTAYGRAQPSATSTSTQGEVPRRKETKARSIGVNRLSTPRGTVHYPLADVLGSKVLTQRVPRIKSATRYVAEGVQDGLQPVSLRGEVPIDPGEGELFKQVVEARRRVRADKRVPPLEREARQRSLKTSRTRGATESSRSSPARRPAKIGRSSSSATASSRPLYPRPKNRAPTASRRSPRSVLRPRVSCSPYSSTSLPRREGAGSPPTPTAWRSSPTTATSRRASGSGRSTAGRMLCRS
jgi:hypothetical protein